MAAPVVDFAPMVEAPLNSTNGTDAPHGAPHSLGDHGGAWGTQPLRPPFDLWLIQVRGPAVSFLSLWPTAALLYPVFALNEHAYTYYNLLS